MLALLLFATILSGPCQSTPAGVDASLFLKRNQLLRAGKKVEALEVTKDLLRRNCDNQYWWRNLENELVGLKRWSEAVDLLTEAEAHNETILEQDLFDPKSGTAVLRKTPEYQGSEIAKAIGQRRAAFEERQKEAQARLRSDSHPPDQYVARNACPFECCRYGIWTTTASIDLWDKPNSTRKTARVEKGERVEALTGNVYIHPTPVLVLEPNSEAGQIFYLLDYLGEGSAHAWRDGKVIDMDMSGIGDYCPTPGQYCSAEYMAPYSQGIWWVKVRTKSGQVGWTKQVKNFSGADGCG